jgi:hypothetical protein
MTQGNTTDNLSDFDQQTTKLPQMLNVLTILTFIGCGIGYIFALATPGIMKWSLKMMDKAKSSGVELSPKEIEEMEKGREAINLAMQNMTAIIIVSIVAISLCLLGAIWMRKYRKDGFYIYTLGELAPIATSFIFMGSKAYGDTSQIVMGIVIPVLFVVLYATQLKYLKR